MLQLNNITNTTAAPDASENTDISLTDAFLCTVAVILCVFIIGGNGIAICAIWRTPALRSLANTYVTSLAVADCVVGATLILLALFLLPPTIHLFHRSINLCVAMQGLNIGMTTVSALHMTIIAIDRYLYITKPYLYQRLVNIKVVVAAIIFAWLFGLFYSFLPQFIYVPYGEKPLCDITETLPIGYLFYSNYVIYFTLVLVIVIMYGRILQTAFRQQSAIQAIAEQVSDTKGQSPRTRKNTMRSVKFFLTVFGAFFICLTPVIVCMGLDFYTNVPAPLYRFFNLLALTNSGMNFIIFAILNKQFRQAFLKVMHVSTTPEERNGAEMYSTAPSTAFTVT